MKHLKKFNENTAGQAPSDDMNTQSTPSNGRKLNYCNAGYGQIFWDENNNIICGIHENDGDYRSEYMNGLFEHYGIEVIHHKKVPAFVKEWDGYDNYGY